jgi:hypothetical protein
MTVLTENLTISYVEEKIIHTLLYYDIFNYPLKAEEIFWFLGAPQSSPGELEKKLISLKRKGVVFQFGNLFSIQNNEANALRRIRGNEEAKKALPKAAKQAKLIGKFPFVRSVMASGSLAKGFMDKDSDLDFFIITEPKRLWIARTLLVAYKRIFLFNSHRHFCVNYFLDSDHLQLDEKNLFTATELATVIPLFGKEFYLRLHEENAWIAKLLPNYQSKSTEGVSISHRGFVKRMTEAFINFLFPERVDAFFQSLTKNRWQRIYRKFYAEQDFQIAFKSRNYTSKNHPNHYQQKVQDMLNCKIQKFDMKIESTWLYE